MWFIFIAVLIVVAVMLVFLLMAIRLLASQAKQSLDRVLYEEPGSL